MKLGRPSLSEAQKKAKLTGVRFRHDERKLIEKAAQKHGQKLSEWMRLTLLAAAEEEINAEKAGNS